MGPPRFPQSDPTILDRIAGNTALLAVNRVGLPLALAWLGWVTVGIMDVDRRVAVIEAGRDAASRQMLAASEAVGRVEGRQAATEATMAAVLRSLTRIEAVLDRRQ